MILLKEKKYVFNKDISECVKLTKVCFASSRIREIIFSLHYLKATSLRKLNSWTNRKKQFREFCGAERNNKDALVDMAGKMGKSRN